MNTIAEAPADLATIVMHREFDAPRELVWQAMTEPRHVARWWGGPGVTNPICEMDVRPGGTRRHVMRFRDGRELRMDFVFLEVENPDRLVWRPADIDVQSNGVPPATTTVTLVEAAGRTTWRMVAQFRTLAERDFARSVGFTGAIEASCLRLVEVLAAWINRGSEINDEGRP
jgi:uncharacterized protein YndB with AHSA1/START domain